MDIREDDQRAVNIVSAIRGGDVARLRELLADDPSLATARIVDAQGTGRTLLHVVADWPGHFQNGGETVAALIAAGADPDAPVANSPVAPETPLHWAASSDDVAVLDALLDGGADIEAPGAVFTGGTAMSDAVIFAQWNAARRLLARGAQTNLSQAAALGLADRVADLATDASPHDITNALWHACRAGQRETAELLLARGGDLHWVGHDRKTPLQVARESGSAELMELLRAREAS